MDLLFHSKASFTTALVELISIICFHLFLMVIETSLVFYYGHPGEDESNKGLISKLLVIFGMHIVGSFLITLATDFGISEYKSGFISGFEVDKYWAVTYFVKELTAYFFLTYAKYFIEADNDAGYLKPWSKALIFVLIKSTGLLILYFIVYAILEQQTIDAVACLPMYQDDPKLAFTPTFGEPSCIPICKVHWLYDPSICLEYETINQKTDVGLTQGFLAINQVTGIFIFAIFYSVGLIYAPIRQWQKLSKYRSEPILKETDVQVARAELAEIARAMKVVGEALHKRCTPLIAERRKSKSLFHFSRVSMKYQHDKNRYMSGCYLLFDQFDLIDERKNLPNCSVFRLPWEWTKFVVITISSFLLFLYICIYRIGDSFRYDSKIATMNSPFNWIVAIFADLGIFPLSAAVHFAFIGTMLLYSIAGFKGFVNVCALTQPFCTLKKGRVRMREMTTLCFMVLFVCSGLPYLQAVHLNRSSEGTWVQRNLFSVVQTSIPSITAKAIPEWTGLSFAALFCLIAFSNPPQKYPFGMSPDNDPIDKANEIAKKWDSGNKHPNKLAEKMKRVDAKVSRKGKQAKTGIAMKAGKAQMGV